jgi:pimeloyl-ACP methyl ester carboxylesterase
MQVYYRDQKDVEGYLYLAPRAPNDVWNGFYDWYNLRLTENLIRQQVLLNNVDPDRIFLLGYSHGGYGAFHVGLNMADRFAAVHASAAAPTEGNRPGRNLRNTPFTFMIGERDTMYERLDRCRAFDAFIRGLQAAAPDAYPVAMDLKLGHGHGGLPDRDQIREMYPHVRNPVPRRVTWAVGGTTQRFHWLGVPEPKEGDIEAWIDGNAVVLQTHGVAELEVSLDERLVDWTRQVTIDSNGRRTDQALRPSLRTLCETLEERGDPRLAFTARVRVEPPARRARL